MKKSVDVRNMGESEALDTAWADEAIRTAVLAFGTLMLLPGAERHKVIRYVLDVLEPGRMPPPLNLTHALAAEQMREDTHAQQSAWQAEETKHASWGASEARFAKRKAWEEEERTRKASQEEPK